MSVRPELVPYELALSKSFQKQFAHLSDQDATRVAGALQRLSLEGLGDVKDVGDDMAGAFRLRVGSLRILFDVQAQRILVQSMEKRGEAFKKRSRNKRKK
jgi:mRNA-degrading endonuclease RelE of RelBE toxin-antitoxin system